MKELVVRLLELETPAPKTTRHNVHLHRLMFTCLKSEDNLASYFHDSGILEAEIYLSAICCSALPLGSDIMRSEIV